MQFVLLKSRNEVQVHEVLLYAVAVCISVYSQFLCNQRSKKNVLKNLFSYILLLFGSSKTFSHLIINDEYG